MSGSLFGGRSDRAVEELCEGRSHLGPAATGRRIESTPALFTGLRTAQRYSDVVVLFVCNPEHMKWTRVS